MKARSKHSSCKDLKKKVSLQLEIDESLVDSKPSKNNLSGTLAQSIPRLPETKFFPSSCRNLNVSLNTKAFNTISANIKTTQIANNSAVNLHNFSLEQPMKKDHTVNYSQFSVKSEQNSSVSKWADLPLPASPLAVISAFPMKLTKYEYGEILKFPAVYFIGADSKKLITTENPSENFGFDDENGYYKPVLHDHIAYRYEVFEILGKGSFSQVFRVFDYKHQSFSALKIIKNKKRFYQQGLIEIDILKNLRKKDSTNNNNIIHIQSSFMFRNHICICFELLSINLYEFLKFNRFQGLSQALIKRFAFQILQALVLLQQSRIVHCDLKPENILLRSSNCSSVKVIDFGSSCYNDKKMYTYIQSRFYRAPEVILGVSYGTAIDMWSFGCILTELFTGRPIFPGENEAQQLLCIMDCIGPPPNDFLLQATRKKLFFDSENRPKVQADSKRRHKSGRQLREVLRNADENFIRLIECCFVWEPNYRITPQQALTSEWMTETVKVSKPEKFPNTSTFKNTGKTSFNFD